MKEFTTPEDFINYCESLEMKDIPDAYAQINEDLKADSKVQDYVLGKNGLAFEFFDAALRSDKSYVFNKISLSPLAPYMLEYVDDSLVGNDDLLEAASKESPHFHRFLDEVKWSKDEDWYKKIASFNHHTIYHMPDEVKNSVEMCEAFLDINVWSFKFFTDEMKGNKRVQRYAVKKNGYVFSEFDEILKCDRNFIVGILEDCWGSDNAAYLIFEVCDELKNDQKLRNLAVERDFRIFEAMYPEDSRSKELFNHYLKVTPKIFRYVSEDLRDDEGLFLALLSGGYDDKMRVELFSKSKFYNDKTFAEKLIRTTDYPGSLGYLSSELQNDADIISIFTSRYQEARHIGSIPKEVITKEIADFYMDIDFDAIYHIKDNEVTQKLFDLHRAKVINKVRYASPEVYRSITGKLSDIPEVFRAFMKNPLITYRDVDSVSYQIRSNDDLTVEREKLMVHLKKPFFKDLYNEKKKDDSFSFYAKGVERKKYVNTLEATDTDILTLLISDEYRWVREAAASKIFVTDQELSEMLENGIPIIMKKDGEWIIEIKHDRYVLLGLIFNENVKTDGKEQIKKLLKEEEKYSKQFDIYEIGYKGGVSPVESAAGKVEVKEIVDCIVEFEGEWDDYMSMKEWYNIDEFWHTYGVKDVATHVKLPDGTIEAIEISPRPADEEFKDPTLESCSGISGEGFANITESLEESFGWDNWKRYTVELEFEFNSESVKPLYDVGICDGYAYENDKEYADFGVIDDYSTTGKHLEFTLYHYKKGKCVLLEPSEIVDIMKEKGKDYSDREIALGYLNDFLNSQEY